jgi:uncharacterized protein YhfF
MRTTDSDPADAITEFWERARIKAKANPVPGYLGVTAADTVTPPAWSFGATPEHAEELLALVLEGTKTATASARWDYDAEDEPLPQTGDLSIVLDGGGAPRALIRTTEVVTVPFDQVDAEHARLEGEGDRTLATWRDIHQRFFTEHRSHDREFSSDMPVVLERFEVVYP